MILWVGWDMSVVVQTDTKESTAQKEVHANRTLVKTVALVSKQRVALNVCVVRVIVEKRVQCGIAVNQTFVRMAPSVLSMTVAFDVFVLPDTKALIAMK